MPEPLIEDREVSWKVLDIPIYGTVTAPKGRTPHSAVVFVAGSGPTDRNWCSPLLPGTNGSAKLLAEALAGLGFLSLRYDKLASGPHVRENLPKFAGRISMQSHLDELKGAVETILDEKGRGVGRENLFVLTNSEGAIHAVNYQLQAKRNTKFRALVLTGAPGRAIVGVSRTQIFEQVRSLPNAETIMKHYDNAMSDFIEGRQVVVDSSLPEIARMLIQGLESPANLPFSRELWTYNLPEHLARIEEPILVVIGKKDIQIDWKLDGASLEKSLSKNDLATFAYPENANHVLKYEPMPRENLAPQYVTQHYNAEDGQLDEDAAKVIFKWLDEQRRNASGP